MPIDWVVTHTQKRTVNLKFTRSLLGFVWNRIPDSVSQNSSVSLLKIFSIILNSKQGCILLGFYFPYFLNFPFHSMRNLRGCALTNYFNFQQGPWIFISWIGFYVCYNDKNFVSTVHILSYNTVNYIFYINIFLLRSF